jgi:hypothetical protein
MLTAADYTTAELAEIQRAISTKPRGPHLLIDSWIAKDSAHHWRSMATRAVTPSEAESRCTTAREFDQRAEDFLREWRNAKMQDINQEAITMTTTPTTNPRPAIPAAVPPSVSPALLEVQKLREEVHELSEQIKDLDALMSGVMTAINRIEQRQEKATVDAIMSEIVDLRNRQIEHWAKENQQPAAQNTAPDAHGNGVVVFHCEKIVVGWDDKAGKIAYKAKGGRYAEWGVRVWPEVLPLFGIVAKEHTTPGEEITIDLDVKAELAEAEILNKDTGEKEKKMVARKVIGLT